MAKAAAVILTGSKIMQIELPRRDLIASEHETNNTIHNNNTENA